MTNQVMETDTTQTILKEKILQSLKTQNRISNHADKMILRESLKIQIMMTQNGWTLWI